MKYILLCFTFLIRGVNAWESATFFDFHNGNNLLPGINYIRHAYSWKNGRKDDQ